MADLLPDVFEARMAEILGRQRASAPAGEPATAHTPAIEASAPAPTASAPSTTASDEIIGQNPGFESLAQREPVSLLPLSEEALNQVAASQGVISGARPQRVPASKFDLPVRLGARPGVPFDMTGGISWRNRLTMEREPTKEEQLQSLAMAYGKENVRLNDFGQPVVTTTDDKTGETKDVLVNPVGLDWTDTAALASQAPEIAGSVIPLLLSRGATLGPGILKALATLGMSIGGSEVAGGLKDLYTRWSEGREMQPKEVAARRLAEGAMQGGFGALLGGAGFVAGRLVSPFSKVGTLNLDAGAAQKYFASKYGIDLPMTAGQKTGSPLLVAAESLEGQQPGSRTVFSRFREKQLAKVQELKDIATGKISDTETVGKSVLEKIKADVSPLEFDVELAAKEANDLAANAIKTTIGAPVDKVQVGDAIGLGAKAKKAGFDKVNEANYGAFYSNPLATEKVIGGKSLKDAVDALLDDLPSVQKEITKPVIGANGQPLVDHLGNPITRTELANIPVNTPVRERLEEISSKLANGRISINDLKQIRTDVDNAIKTGEAVPGVKEGRLKAYYSELTKAIDKGLTEIGDPGLRAAWDKATSYYKNNVGRFEKAGIAELFRDPINAIGPTEIVERAARNPDIYAAYRDFFGANSAQLKGVQQAVRDDLLQLGNLGKTVDAAQFARRLEELDRSSPQLLKDALGKNAQVLRDEALTMMRAQGQQLPKEELDRVLAGGRLSGDRLKEMLQAEGRRTAAYNNDLVRSLSQGTLGPDRIKPTQVVDRFVFDAGTQPEHLKELMAVAGKDPDVQQDLRQLTFKKVLDNVTARDRQGNLAINPRELDAVLNNPDLSKKLQTVLGPSSYEDLSRLRDFLLPTDVSYMAGRTAGSLSGGTLLNRVLAHGDLSAVPQFVKNFVLSAVYTSDSLRALLSNTVLKSEGKALVVNTAIASEPFLKALVTTYRKEKAKEVQQTIKGYVNQAAMRNPQEAQQGVTKGTEGIPWDEFSRRVDEISARQGQTQQRKE